MGPALSRGKEPSTTTHWDYGLVAPAVPTVDVHFGASCAAKVGRGDGGRVAAVQKRRYRPLFARVEREARVDGAARLRQKVDRPEEAVPRRVRLQAAEVIVTLT